MRLHICALTAIAAPLALGACASGGLTASEQSAASETTVQADYLKEEVSALNEITSIYIDAAALYKQASRLPDENNGLSPMLMELHDDRNADREALQGRVIALGGKPATLGEPLGTGHRTFTSLRTVVDNDSEVAVEEVLRGEKYIHDRLMKVADMQLTPETRSLVEKLESDVSSEIETLQSL